MKRKQNIKNFADAVAATIRHHRLLADGDRVVVGLSGGADSVALLSVLGELGYECLAAHCNFHLRGEESQRDMRHAEKICRRLGVDLTVRDFDVAARCRETGGSVEMVCRDQRYEWFGDLIDSFRARAVAVGHHREDNIETMLLNLFRGTGIDGLRGIRYRRDSVIRPLLDVSRRDIETYLAERGLDYVNDSSNCSDAHLRNRIRNHVMPEIERCFGRAEQAMLLTMENLAETQALCDRAVASYRQACSTQSGDLDIVKLADMAGDCAATALYGMLKPDGFTASVCRDIISSPDRSGLKFDGRKDVEAELDRGILHIRKVTQHTRPTSYPADLSRDILSPVCIRVSEHDASAFRPERNPSVVCLDSTVLEGGHCLTLRRWRKGDRIRPFGMNGSRAVSDVFSDAKYSAADKRRAWLLDCDGEVLWIVGLRASRLFTVGPQTKKYLRLEYKPIT